MADVARHVSVTGRVQGVFFRAWIAEQARRARRQRLDSQLPRRLGSKRTSRASEAPSSE